MVARQMARKGWFYLCSSPHVLGLLGPCLSLSASSSAICHRLFLPIPKTSPTFNLASHAQCLMSVATCSCPGRLSLSASSSAICHHLSAKSLSCTWLKLSCRFVEALLFVSHLHTVYLLYGGGTTCPGKCALAHPLPYTCSQIWLLQL